MDIESTKFHIGTKDKGKRLDVFLSKKLSITRSQAQKLIKNKQIIVNNKIPTKTGIKLKKNDVVEIGLEAEGLRHKIDETQTYKIKIKIVHETNDYLVINKPAGVLTHPTQANEQNTLTAWLLEKFPEIKNVGEYKNRPGIVHRLDKDASGLLVIAKNQEMFKYLKKQFQKRIVEKYYSILVYGNIEADHDTIDFDIDRGKEGKMVSRPKINKFKLKNILKIQQGKKAITEFWIEKRFSRFTLLRVKIHTGRTHQIRVHMLAFGHPVVGDKLYLNKKLIKKQDEKLGRLFLHANKLCFDDLENEKQCFEAELPEKLTKFLETLK